jgi:hypothetical protein
VSVPERRRADTDRIEHHRRLDGVRRLPGEQHRIDPLP